jgi:hypothetical protein
VNAHSAFSELIDTFVDVFNRLREYLDDYQQRNLKELWRNGTVERNASFNEYFAPFVSACSELLCRQKDWASRPDEIRWVGTVSSRILAALRSDQKPLLRFRAYDTLVSWWKFLSSVHLQNALGALNSQSGWLPLFELTKENPMYSQLSDVLQWNSTVIPNDVIDQVVVWISGAPASVAVNWWIDRIRGIISEKLLNGEDVDLSKYTAVAFDPCEDDWCTPPSYD